VYHWVEHTAELELALEGSGEAEIFADALAALRELLVDAKDGPLERREIALSSSQRATLLADWLSELVFLAETEDFVPERVIVLDLTPNGLRATVEGYRGEPPHLVKAVTYHKLEFEAAEQGVRARVVLDV
jgi:SHS2 domain-containing protein